MWIVELAFGAEGAEPDRLAARPAHRARLVDQHRAGIVRMAGPLADDTGAVLVIDLPDRPAFDAFLAEDPYFTTPGVRVRQIRDWQPFLC